ncbi:unnamed protein product [Symbiodinium sp. CCMP2592]|nr:unnamed protein product [Symbiodinium sp. CCMP2592]
MARFKLHAKPKIPERRLEPGTLELRTIDEALHGDVSKPLPRPVLFPEEYQNFKQGILTILLGGTRERMSKQTAWAYRIFTSGRD